MPILLRQGFGGRVVLPWPGLRRGKQADVAIRRAHGPERSRRAMTPEFLSDPRRCAVAGRERGESLPQAVPQADGDMGKAREGPRRAAGQTAPQER